MVALSPWRKSFKNTHVLLARRVSVSNFGLTARLSSMYNHIFLKYMTYSSHLLFIIDLFIRRPRLVLTRIKQFGWFLMITTVSVHLLFIRQLIDEWFYVLVDKYTVWCTGEHELYDIKKDPYATKNIYNDASSRLVKRLDALLSVLKACRAHTCRDPWRVIHPDDDSVTTLKDALNKKVNSTITFSNNRTCMLTSHL